MALTPEGTPYVESSDLVANYPAASLALANRVDLVGILPFADSTARGTALPTPTDGQYSYLQDTNSTEYWNGAAWVPAGTVPGLTHINTTTFSAVSSVSINNLFSSTYTNYLMVMDNVICSNDDVNLNLRYRSSTTDTTTGYRFSRITFGSNNVQYNFANNSAGTAQIGMVGNTLPATYTLVFGRPNTTDSIKGLLGQSTYLVSTILATSNNAGSVASATQFDGVTIYPDTGTISGTARTYGYRNS